MKLKSSIFAGLAALTLLFPNLQDSKLPDITKPYLGEYECERATLGEKDFTDGFSYITLELNSDETFTLRYKPKGGKRHEETGTYSYDREKEELCLYSEENGTFKRTVPIKNGEFCLTFTIGSNTMVMKFTRK